MVEDEKAPGYTATLAAVGRAVHAESESPLVADHLALGLAGEAGATLMAQMTSQLPEASRQSFGLAFAIRTRFVEDAIAAAIQEGIGQYVILGAGLDSFAYRRPELSRRLKIFEVDRAASQAWKRSRLEKLQIAIPVSVAFIPLDHETDDLRAGLVDAGLLVRAGCAHRARWGSTSVANSSIWRSRSSPQSSSITCVQPASR